MLNTLPFSALSLETHATLILNLVNVECLQSKAQFVQLEKGNGSPLLFSFPVNRSYHSDMSEGSTSCLSCAVHRGLVSLGLNIRSCALSSRPLGSTPVLRRGEAWLFLPLSFPPGRTSASVRRSAFLRGARLVHMKEHQLPARRAEDGPGHLGRVRGFSVVKMLRLKLTSRWLEERVDGFDG